jgi:hypothetical protein
MLTKSSTKVIRTNNTDNKISYLKDKNGRKRAVIVPIKLYKEYLEKFEDDLDIKVADSIMSNNPKFNKYSPDNYL